MSKPVAAGEIEQIHVNLFTSVCVQFSLKRFSWGTSLAKNNLYIHVCPLGNVEPRTSQGWLRNVPNLSIHSVSFQTQGSLKVRGCFEWELCRNRDRSLRAQESYVFLSIIWWLLLLWATFPGCSQQNTYCFPWTRVNWRLTRELVRWVVSVCLWVCCWDLLASCGAMTPLYSAICESIVQWGQFMLSCMVR